MTSSEEQRDDTFASITRLIREFRDARDWKQFHTLKDLAIAVSVEAGELLELVLWKDASEVNDRIQEDDFRLSMAQELGDILIYSILLCHDAGIAPADAIKAKIQENARKYPVYLSKGTSKKYTELRTET